jgi:hypothetical protein
VCAVALTTLVMSQLVEPAPSGTVSESVVSPPERVGVDPGPSLAAKSVGEPAPGPEAVPDHGPEQPSPEPAPAPGSVTEVSPASSEDGGGEAALRERLLRAERELAELQLEARELRVRAQEAEQLGRDLELALLTIEALELEREEQPEITADAAAERMSERVTELRERADEVLTEFHANHLAVYEEAVLLYARAEAASSRSDRAALEEEASRLEQQLRAEWNFMQGRVAELWAEAQYTARDLQDLGERSDEETRRRLQPVESRLRSTIQAEFERLDQGMEALYPEPREGRSWR